MSYNFFMGLVAVASLVVSIIGIIKVNKTFSVSSTINNNYQTVINTRTGEIKKSKTSDPEEWIFFKGLFILISLMTGLYFYFSYFKLSFLILSFINLICVITLFIYSRSSKNVSYIKNINIKLVTLMLAAIYLYISQFKMLIPKSFDIMLFSSNTVDYTTIGTFIISSIHIAIDGVKYTFFTAPFEIKCFLISRMFFIFVIIVYFIDIFISIYRMAKGKYVQHTITKLIMNFVLFNSLCLILLLNIMYIVIPYLQAAFAI